MAVGVQNAPAGDGAGLVAPEPAPREPLRARLTRPLAAEVAAVLLAPVVLYLALRVRAMAPPGLPDPAMHTTFIVDPHAILDRFSALFTPTARLREAGRAGFLVPGRILYLMFGAVPAFYVYRYVLALLAIVPLYVLLRRLYGRWAGFAGIAVVMSSPVVLTAWTTDYPDSAALSYLMGGLGAVAISWLSPHRGRWLCLAGALLTFAVWSHGAAVPLIGSLTIVYLAMRLTRERPGLVREGLVVLGTALGVTLGLAVLSKLLIGQFDFISPTVKSAQVLSTPFELAKNHSPSSGWAKYDDYLLVPPAVLAVLALALGRTGLRRLGPAAWFIALTALLQLAVFAYLQFAGSFQSLEMHYFSSTLWSSVSVALALALAELGRPLTALGARDPRWRAVGHALPAFLVLAVAWIYLIVHSRMNLPLATWAPRGLLVCLAVLLAAGLGRLALRPQPDGRAPWAGAAGAGAATLAIVAGLLFLTVALAPLHHRPAHTVFDPRPDYAGALGGDGRRYLDEYGAIAQIPPFVGPPAYRGEALETWVPHTEFGALQGAMGIYHNAFTWVSTQFPVLTPSARRKLAAWRPGQIVLMSRTGHGFATALRSLHPYRPRLAHHGVIRSGTYVLHVWVIDLRRFIRPARS